jgi:hypothetical protein
LEDSGLEASDLERPAVVEVMVWRVEGWGAERRAEDLNDDVICDVF